MVSTAQHYRRDPDSGPGKSLGNIWGGAGEGEVWQASRQGGGEAGSGWVGENYAELSKYKAAGILENFTTSTCDQKYVALANLNKI